jgi:large subunit ribosomal protein L29
MKMKEITELSMDELLTKRRDLRQESLHLRLQQQSGQLEQPSRLRLLRRDIARLETVLSQRKDRKEGIMAEQDQPLPSATLAARATEPCFTWIERVK